MFYSERNLRLFGLSYLHNAGDHSLFAAVRPYRRRVRYVVEGKERLSLINSDLAAACDYNGVGVDIGSRSIVELTEESGVFVYVFAVDVDVRERFLYLESGRVDHSRVGGIASVHEHVGVGGEVDIDFIGNIREKLLCLVRESVHLLLRHIYVPVVLLREGGEYNIEDNDYCHERYGERRRNRAVFEFA